MAYSGTLTMDCAPPVSIGLHGVVISALPLKIVMFRAVSHKVGNSESTTCKNLRQTSGNQSIYSQVQFIAALSTTGRGQMESSSIYVNTVNICQWY